MLPILYSFVSAFIGVAFFLYFDLPLPWLLGPIFACLIAALLGVPMKGVRPINETMRTLLGVAVGATMTPAVIAAFPAMWPTLILVPVMVICIGLAGVPYFMKYWNFDFPTAYYSTMPGGLQDMLIFGEEAGGNIRRLSLIHATRVTVIVVALPFLLRGIWDADLGNPPGSPLTSVPINDLLLMAACAIGGWRVAKYFGLFGSSILGPLIATAALASTGILQSRAPAEAIWAAQFFIGMTIGAKYSGITMNEVRNDLLAGGGFCAILIALSFVFVVVILAFNLAPGQEALLSFAPGGQAELTVLALIVGADAAFVVAHHVIRIFTVIIGAPVAMRFFDRGPEK